MPGAFVRLIGTERTFLYRGEPQDELLGRAPIIPQGRMLGGGSSINAMVYVRGQPQDYDGWAANGCAGWAWSDVLPVFLRSEANEILAGPLHGTKGPLRVSEPRHRHPLSRAFVRAAQEAGLPFSRDFNGPDQEGVGFCQTTTFDGQRGSTAATYLAGARRHPALSVMTGLRVLRLVLDGRRVTGVEVRPTAGGPVQTLHARAEVILSAGALSSPAILMRSGIGPAADLTAAGVEVHHDLPGVGANFQDHLEVSVYGRTREPISLAGQDRGLAALRHGIEYTLFRGGLLTSTVVESGGFADTTGSGRPDIQFHVLPVLAGDADREPLEGHGISINPCYLRPASRGRVRLRSSDPDAPILLEAGYLTERQDVDTLIRGVRLARRILRQPSLQALISEEMLPSATEDLTDAEIEAHVRQFAKTVYHPAGTCRMGSNRTAVVDPSLKVVGTEGLRVADASVMPELVSGNTNAPTIMIAERCADFLLQSRP
ncbi:MAG: GMC family oxidoreductase N-terminal domain-containing protein, partial [Rhodobacteraceae bacterium]|nr:GMC family oxidoreductase N-terminal domain-containing protein [Paracoccaceae bacterium]